MKTERMPTVKALYLISWIVALSGLSLSAIILILKGISPRYMLIAFIVSGGGFISAAFIRASGIIAQILFDFKKEFLILSVNVNRSMENLNLKTYDICRDIKQLDSDIGNYIRQANSDIKDSLHDINDNINKIKVFFEQIERHLDLKR